MSIAKVKNIILNLFMVIFSVTELKGLVRLRENRLTGTVPEEILASGKLSKSFMQHQVALLHLSHTTFLVCFDASQNLMENSIPQGECPSGTVGSLSTVCHDINDPTCSCCTCLPEGSSDYCNIQLSG